MTTPNSNSESVTESGKAFLLAEMLENDPAFPHDKIQLSTVALSRTTLESLIGDMEMIETVVSARVQQIRDLGGIPEEKLQENAERIEHMLEQLRTLWDNRYHENKKLHDSKRNYWGVQKLEDKKTKKP